MSSSYVVHPLLPPCFSRSLHCKDTSLYHPRNPHEDCSHCIRYTTPHHASTFWLSLSVLPPALTFLAVDELPPTYCKEKHSLAVPGQGNGKEEAKNDLRKCADVLLLGLLQIHKGYKTHLKWWGEETLQKAFVSTLLYISKGVMKKTLQHSSDRFKAEAAFIFSSQVL